MAEDKAKKPKIDLKARLGKGGGGAAPSAVPVPTTTPIPGGSAPPSSDSGSSAAPPAATATPLPPPPIQTPIPAPIAAPRSGGGIAPPPMLSPGIPLPPFASRPAAQAAPKPTAQAQTIKVEIGEEVHEERAKASRKTAIAAVASAAIAIVVGIFVGQAMEKGNTGARTTEGAKKLEPDVKAANDKMKELDDKLTSAQTALNNKTYADDLVGALPTLKIPFDASNVEGKAVGNMPQKLQHMILAYTSAVEDLDKKRESLKNLLGGFKEQITKGWKEEKEPMANFAVTFRQEGGKTVAQMVPVKTPFAWGKDPEKITIMVPEGQRSAEKNATRWLKGDLTPSDPVAIPVDPKTVPNANNGFGLVMKALYDMRTILEGNKEDPTKETAGLLKDGDDLAVELHKAGLSR